MTDTRISDLGIRAIAAFVAEHRPDFDALGVVAALRQARDDYDPWQLAVAMIRRASDPRNLTPRLQGFDADGVVSCRRHPGAAVRTDGLCGICFAEANADESGGIHDRGGKPISAEARALIDAAISSQRHAPVESDEERAARLAAARAELDAVRAESA